MLVISVLERYFRLGLKNLIPLKVNLLCINHRIIIHIAYSSTYIHKFTPNIQYINETNTSPRNVPLSCCRSVNSFLRRAPIFVATSHQTRLTTLLLAANKKPGRVKASWNKARISYKRCACPRPIWISSTQTGK